MEATILSIGCQLVNTKSPVTVVSSKMHLVDKFWLRRVRGVSIRGSVGIQQHNMYEILFHFMHKTADVVEKKKNFLLLFHQRYFGLVE